MECKKRLIYANDAYEYAKGQYRDGKITYEEYDAVLQTILDADTADAVEVVMIKEVMQKILETLDIIKTTDEELASYTTPNSYYRGKVDAFEITRRLVNAALTDLCDNCGAKMDGGNEDG